MLDAKITLFDVKIQRISPNFDSNRLVLNSCKAIVYENTYSEFNELNFANINDVDLKYGCIEYEFGFDEKFKDPYKKFFISIFEIKGDMLKFPIKIDPPRPSIKTKPFFPENYTKVNKNGNMVLGVRYYFRNYEEKRALLDGKEVLIEGCIALGKRYNIYGIMCRIKKGEKEWILEEANTYRIHKNTDIYSLWH